MRIFWVIPLFILTIILAVGGTYLSAFKPFYVPPPIVKDIKVSHGGWPSNNEELLKRLEEKYPPHTSEDFLIEDLKKQGFKIEGQKAILRIERLPCTLKWRISWKIDTEQKLTFTFAGGASVCL